MLRYSPVDVIAIDSYKIFIYSVHLSVCRDITENCIISTVAVVTNKEIIEVVFYRTRQIWWYLLHSHYFFCILQFECALYNELIHAAVTDVEF